MPLRPSNERYSNLLDHPDERLPTPWYWRLIALLASWMIVAGYVDQNAVCRRKEHGEFRQLTVSPCRYLILPGLYAKDPQLRFSQVALTVFVVALLTAGYSFTALLCFACRDELFQAEAVFL